MVLIISRKFHQFDIRFSITVADCRMYRIDDVDCYVATQRERTIPAAAAVAATAAGQADETARQSHQSQWTRRRRLRSLYTTVFITVLASSSSGCWLT